MNIYADICNEYVYLIRDREHILLNNNIYKVGKTKQHGIKRLNNYSSGSELIIQLKVRNCDIMEKKIITLFKEKYERFEGIESFVGNGESMKEDIYQLCKTEVTQKETTEEEKEDPQWCRVKFVNELDNFVNELDNL